MRKARIILLIIGAFFYAGNSFAQYSGGDNDGSSFSLACIQSLNGTSALIAGPITGSTTFCAFATETYSISPSGTTSTTIYTWSVPAGATIISGQGTTSVLVSFGNTNGNVSVDVTNECTTVNTSLAVTQGSCNFYSGGSNDGFSFNLGCIQQLGGGAAFIPGPIVGSTEFCPFATESYSITVAGATSNAIYTWSVPAGATIISGQGTSSVLITFGGTNGTISVDISNECITVNQTLAVTAGSCTFFAGGSNDGFASNVGCIQTLNGASALIAGAITGSTEFCPFATEVYSIQVSGTTSTTVYNWSVPAGATITSGQGTNSILVTFGGTNGTIQVDISNECSSTSQTLGVTASSCTFFAGGSNDGFAVNDGCIQSLNGGAGLVPGPITGPAQFCSFSTETYSITVAGSTSTTVYNWSVPAGSSIISGQGTSSILVSFGSTNGNISVSVSNTCTTVNPSLAVTNTSCLFYSGGSNDGFSVATSVSGIPLPIELYSFDATESLGKVQLKWVTLSELNNDYFQVQRTIDGDEFEAIVDVEGAGTTNEKNTYRATDNNPYLGKSYYRLMQTDFDGKKTYSRLVQVIVAGELSEITLHPNPVRINDPLVVRFHSEKTESLVISAADLLGRATGLPIEITSKPGWNDLSFTNRFPAPGLYVIMIRSRTRQEAIRVVVLD